MTSGEKRGGLPKCNIQFNRAPSNIIKSASFKALLTIKNKNNNKNQTNVGFLFFIYVDRAAAMQNSESSSTTPFPIGVGKNGIFSVLTNCVISFSALAYAEPKN